MAKSKHRLRLENWISEQKPCVICGLKCAVDREHVPPQSIFLTPKPSNLVTIPACDDCNNSTSNLDEEFRAYLSLSIGIENDNTLNYWNKGALPTLLSNNRLRTKILNSTQIVDVFSQGGIYLGKSPAVQWAEEKHNIIIEKTVRGLYWKHI